MFHTVFCSEIRLAIWFCSFSTSTSFELFRNC
jgi:hypothetical protein